MAMEFFLTAVLMFLLSLIFSVEQRRGGTNEPPRCYGQGELDSADKPAYAPEGPTKGVGILLLLRSILMKGNHHCVLGISICSQMH